MFTISILCHSLFISPPSSFTMKQRFPRQWQLFAFANGDEESLSIRLCLEESIRSISSEGSTIAVRRMDKSLDWDKSLADKSVHFATQTTQIIPPAPTPATRPKRQVRFAQQEIIPCASWDVPAGQLWYTERDYASFEQSTQEQCHYFGDRPCFSQLTRAFRALRDGDDQLVPTVTSSSSYNNNNHVANLVGLEHWMINTARHTRREEISRAIRHWQRTAPSLPSLRQRQVARVSQAQSRPARQFAHFVAKQIAASVQQDGKANSSDSS